MTYDLYIGDKTFSSWSLRGWLMLEKFSLSYRTHDVGLYSGTMREDLATLAPARLVPVLRTPEGDVIGESLAIAETLAERHPEQGLWPSNTAHRARARWLCAEMASGFSALRSHCPMQLEHVNSAFDAPDTVRADLERLEEIWASARDLSGVRDGWLFGEYSLADVFFAPIAARITGYDLPVSEAARDYIALHLSDPAFRVWRSEGLKKTYTPFPYPTTSEKKPWPDFNPVSP